MAPCAQGRQTSHLHSIEQSSTGGGLHHPMFGTVSGDGGITVPRARFYVYAYYDPRKSSFEPFYVGKGCGNRNLQQLKDANRIGRELTREYTREIRRYTDADPFFIGIPRKERVWKYLK